MGLPRRKKLVFAAVAVAGFLALLELTARAVEIWKPPMAVDIGAGFVPWSRVFVPSSADSGVLETAATKRSSFRTQTFAARKDASTLRIVVLGGSSVNYADREFREMAARVLDAFRPRWNRVELVNAGGFGYGSGRLRIVAAEILEYDPDVVLLHEANNEFEEVEQLELASLGTLGVQEAGSRSALVRVTRDLLVAWQAERLAAEHARLKAATDTVPDLDRAWDHDFTAAEVAQRMALFRENFAAIADACAQRNVPLVVGTVPSNIVYPAWRDKTVDYQQVRDLFAQGRFEEGKALGRRLLVEYRNRHQSSDAENGIIRSLASDRGFALADVEAAITAAEPHGLPGETLFIDHCHLNDRGRGILAGTYEAAVVAVLRTASASPPR